jgi:pyruvate dehydrogenase E2 component (dihydrolipoamide acetyltransferase)
MSEYSIRRPPHIVEFLGHVGSAEVKNYWNVPGWMDVDMEAANALRARLKEQGTPITHYPLIVRAITQAVKEAMVKNPEVNAMRVGWLWKRLVYFKEIVTAVTAASENEAGESSFHLCLIREANTKTLQQLAQEIRTQSKAATDDPAYKLPRWLIRPLLFFGRNLPSAILKYRGTVLITSLGMFGVNLFSMGNRNLAFSYGPVEKRAVVITDEKGEEKIVARYRVTITVSMDHRTLEGAPTAALMARIRQLLESPPKEWTEG